MKSLGTKFNRNKKIDDFQCALYAMISLEDMKLLKEKAKNNGLPVSEVIRRLIKKYLRSMV